MAVRGGRLHLFTRGGKSAEWAGDVLFTHEGISGPAALAVSRAAALALERGEAELRLDFFPDREHPALDAALTGHVLAHRGKTIGSVLEAWLPNRIVPHLLALANVDPARRGHVLTRAERRAVTGVLKSWTLGRVAGVPIERGEVTAGGVSLDEVDPRTMRSRIVQGLILCGEILDIAGPVGGYNLQAAFSTGYVAGETAARDWVLVRDMDSKRKGAGTQRE